MKLYASLLAMLVLILSCAPSRAAELAPGLYFSMDEAAHDALVDAYNCGEQRRECGGVIYRYENKSAVPYVLYFYTTPEKGRTFGVNITALAETAPSHMKLVADYHTHPCLGRKELAQFFSPADVITNQGFHTVGYMLDNCRGLIHRFDPAQDDVGDEEIDMDSGRKMYLTIGHIAGWIDLRGYR